MTCPCGKPATTKVRDEYVRHFYFYCQECADLIVLVLPGTKILP